MHLDLISITWGCLMATFTASLALVIWQEMDYE